MPNKRKIRVSNKKAPKPRLKDNPFDSVYANSNKKAQIPYVVSKKEPSEEDMSNWLTTLSGWNEGLISLSGEPLVLDEYGREIVDEVNVFSLQNKSRRVGISYAYSMRGLASSHLYHDYQAIFVSYNQDDANNKILYAKMGYDSLPSAWQKKLVVDNIQRLEFESTSGKYKTRTTLISHPQREPRGKGTSRTDVFLDEYAHYTWADQIYVAALPMISFGGCLFIGSTPLGSRGKFYNIATNPSKFRFKITNIPFYDCPRLVDDIHVARLAIDEGMSIREVVGHFGTEILMEIFVNMDEDFFEQEYNCKFLDDASFFFPPEVINHCKFAYRQEDLTGAPYKIRDYPIKQKYKHKKFIYCGGEANVLLEHLSKGKISKNLYAGYDVGRRKDSAEFKIIEEEGMLQTVVFARSFKNIPFEEQRRQLQYYMNTFPIIKLGIDETGIGMQLAEQLQNEFGSRVKTLSFTNVLKNQLFTNLKIRFEGQMIAIPEDMELVKQLISIRRIITNFNSVRYDVDPGELKYHHADRVIALALASYMGTPAQKDPKYWNAVAPTVVKTQRKEYLPQTRGVSAPLAQKMPSRLSDISSVPKLADEMNSIFKGLIEINSDGISRSPGRDAKGALPYEKGTGTRRKLR